MSYVTIQDWMLDLGLPARETLLYAIIYGFSQDGESKCYATQDYLCKWMQCTRPTLCKAIDDLISRGLIVKIQPNPHGKCVYSAGLRCKESLHPCKEPLHQCKESLHNNKDNNNNKEIYIYGDCEDSKKNKPNYESEFAEIWAIYPKQEGRKKALSSYISARKEGVPAETIKQGVEQYLKHINHTGVEARYIKQGGNWFSARRWEDQHIDSMSSSEARRKPHALKYIGNVPYSKEYLQSLGISFGEEFYDDT